MEQFIIIHYPEALTVEEKAPYKHHLTTLKAQNSENTKYDEMLMNRWGTTNPEALNLLEGGYDDFKNRAATRILSEVSDRVFINNSALFEAF